ncbi:MAG: AAA family ATPase [Blautia sp.]|nr:AAA family ATPase [Blautia sp.]
MDRHTGKKRRAAKSLRIGEKNMSKDKDIRKNIGDLYDDLWGGVSEIKQKVEASLEEKAGKALPDAAKANAKKADPNELLKSNMENISGLIKSMSEDLRKNIDSDFAEDLKDSVQELPKHKEEERQLPVEEQAAQPEKAQEEQPKEPEEDPMEQLNALVGLKELKHDVKELINLVKTQKIREESGLKTVPMSLHLVFSGNPGTGKTTIARILASLYKQIGVLSKGQLVEVDRSSLVAGYVGQTAIKTQEKIQEALGGVLFIDEAYTLSKTGMMDFGQEAIDTILKAMEDHRKDLVVIVAGYTDLMKDFVESNPGLKSRFNKYFYFEDYNEEELMEIFRGNCRKYDYVMDEEMEKEVLQRICKMVEEKDENFANARSVRNLFESIVTNQASRIAEMENPTGEDLKQLKAEDIEGQSPQDDEKAEENPTEEEPTEESSEEPSEENLTEENPEEEPSEENQ